MERALAREGLSLALGASERLPSPEDLQELLAQAEVNLFIHQPIVSDEALAVAWYLHGIASTPSADVRYGVPRQRQAFQVSAHILDLALRDEGRSNLDRLRIAFASAVGYLRGELTPNAMAIYRYAGQMLREAEGLPLVEALDTLPFEIGLPLLGLDMGRLRRLLSRRIAGFTDLAREVGMDDLSETAFGTLLQIVQAGDVLRRYLAAGSERRLTEARALLDAASAPQPGSADLDARWVAAHLRTFGDDGVAPSIWKGLPPGVPQAVKQALVWTDPPVITLWRPQADLFSGENASVVAPTTRRVVMSLPTSAGKTLVAQVLALTHLATEADSVCYVAPMRSLIREVRRSLLPRLRALERELPPDTPDFWAEVLADLPMPSIDVMTPERLGQLLRQDADEVLGRYGMFIFDEAHLVADPHRGFDLEWVLSFLNWKTQETHHRIILLSAALGNKAQIMSWIDAEEEGQLFSSEWRGPRRLHAVFYTDADWEQETRETVKSSDWPERVRYPLTGVVQLRPAAGLAPRSVAFTEPLGTLAFRVNAAGRREKKRHSSSTSQYRMSARIVESVGNAGPVLVVMSTRPMARQMAVAITDLVPRSSVTADLEAFVTARLGTDHPLVGLIPHRVAYHHAGLPADVLTALEDALRSEQLLYLTATTTLTEGVNLPVRSVVLAETKYEGRDPGTQILGARLINAMGRAGRATKETEGWVIVCKAGHPTDQDFKQMRPADEDLTVRSRLATKEALDALAEFERVAALSVDAVFEHSAREVEGFIGFVWMLMAGFDELDHAATATDIDQALSATLGFRQLTEANQTRWRAVARLVARTYSESNVAARRRWAKTGTSVGSARDLETIGTAVASAAVTADAQGEAIENAGVAIRVLEGVGAITALTSLRESPGGWTFRTAQNRAPNVEVPPAEFLRRWISGDDFAELADHFLGDVSKREYAIEQVVDFVSGQFEHYLAWTLRVVLDFANERLDAAEIGHNVCPDLPLFIRYGVDRSSAVSLITGGLRSRAFAQRVAIAGEEQGFTDEDGLRAWLQRLSVEQWRDSFGGTPSDLLDLLEYTRGRGRGLLGPLLSSGRASTTVSLRPETADGDVALRRVTSDDPPQRIGIYRGDDLLGQASPGAYSDLVAVIDSGLSFRAAIRDDILILSVAE